MEIRRKSIVLKLAAPFVALPVLLFAFLDGPDRRHTGAPGDQTCAASDCHVGTPVNGGGGRVEMQLPGGLTYTPGQKQTITVVVTDSAAQRYGFQATARLGSNEANGAAGTFTPLGTDFVLCDNGTPRTGASCPEATPVEFVEHSTPKTTSQFQFEWTAPATNVGNVKLYLAANAANGNGANTGDHIYTTSVELTPQASGGGGGTRPAISNNGVVNGASFVPGIVAGSWTTIYGANLAATTRDWTGLISATGEFPTSVEGVSVTIDDRPAFVYFISPGQINVQAPALTRTGMVPVKVTTAAGESEVMMANVAAEAPALFLFTQNSPKYAAAVRSDGALIARSGAVPGANTVAAKPGDVILLFGTGFGPTTPPVAPGRVVSGAFPLTNPSGLQLRIGGMNVTPSFAGLSAAGLYQFNVIIPNVPDGDQLVEMLLNGQQIQADVFLTVQR